MPFDLSQLRELLANVPDWVPGAAAVAAAAVVLIVAIRLMIHAIGTRARRRTGAPAAAGTGRPLNLKLEIGFAVVQGGLSIITITGVFDFFHVLFGMPWMEAAVLAVFIESAIWTSVGFIVEHGRTLVEERKGDEVVMRPATGWGLGGPFFWIFSVAAGLLAVFAAGTALRASGRTVVVVIGTAMWVLRLMRSTHRPARRSRFRWTPYRLGVAWGLIEPNPGDEEDQNTEWRTRRLARALRLRNSNVRLVRWWGGRSLIRLAEEATPEVLRAAQDRFAAAHVLREMADSDSEVMTAIIAGRTATTIQLAQLGTAAELADARRAYVVPAGGARRTGQVVDSTAVDTTAEDDDERTTGYDGSGRDDNVKPIAGQRAEDVQVLTTIVAIVSGLTGIPAFATWAEVREVVAEQQLLNKIEARSQTTDYAMSRPRAKRMLGKAETLLPVPPQVDVARSA